MSEFKGTKGEWQLIEYHYGQLIGIKVVVDNEDGEETIIHDTDTSGYIDNEQEANAKLIACSPEMLEALIKINDFIDKNENVNYWARLLSREVPNIKELINKATE
jgi:hypothetical protein